MWSYCPCYYIFLDAWVFFLQVKLIDVLNNHIKISYDTHLYTCPIPPVLTRFGVSSRTCICIITSCVACIARSPFLLANRLSHLHCSPSAFFLEIIFVQLLVSSFLFWISFLCCLHCLLIVDVSLRELEGSSHIQETGECKLLGWHAAR